MVLFTRRITVFKSLEEGHNVGTMTVTCPYCFEPIEVTLFVEEGEKQDFITDCEVCCHPFEVKASWDNSIDDFYVSIERAD